MSSGADARNLNVIIPMQGPIPLVDMAAQHKPFAKQMQGEIDTYLRGNNKDMQAKCEIAQDILRHVRPPSHILKDSGRYCGQGCEIVSTRKESRLVVAQGIERSPELIDEMYLQLLRHLRGSNRSTSVRGWELLLLAACASRCLL